jgi:glycerate kinase
VNEFGDDEATQVAVPIIDQDQTAENRGINLDLDLDDEYGQVVDGGAGGGGGGGGQVDLNCELLRGQPFILACLQLEAELNA